MADRGAQDEPHIQVKSEEEQDRMLLETKIIRDDGYQKQQGKCPPGIQMAEHSGEYIYVPFPPMRC